MNACVVLASVVLSLIGPLRDDPYRAAYDAGWKAFAEGNYTLSEANFAQAVALAERLGPRSKILATCLHGLASAQYMKNDLAGAEKTETRALGVFEEAGAKDSADAARCLNGLAHIAYVRGEYKDAEPKYLRALKILESAEGGENVGEAASSLVGLADLLYMTGRLDQAEAHYQKAEAALRRANEPENSVMMAHTLAGLANVAALRDRTEEAEALYKKAIKAQETALGADHPDCAESSRVWPRSTTRRIATRTPNPCSARPWRSRKKSRGPRTSNSATPSPAWPMCFI